MAHGHAFASSINGLESIGGGNLVVFGGGYVLNFNNEVIEAIGVSGGSVEQDMICAKAAVTYLEKLGKK